MLVLKVIQDFFKEKEKQTGKTNIFDPMNMAYKGGHYLVATLDKMLQDIK